MKKILYAKKQKQNVSDSLFQVSLCELTQASMQKWGYRFGGI